MRTIEKIHLAERADMDDLVTYRAMPTSSLDMGDLDPFIFLNHHGHQVYPPANDGLPFGPHPHRGFETVTFILQGSLIHKDSGGFESLIREGGIQWMTAGSGIIHSELSPDEFKRGGGELEILQLWVNLPSRLKMTRPSYVGLQKDQIPALTIDDGRINVQVVSGHWDQTRGAIQPLTDVHLATVRMQSGGKLSRSIPTDRTIFFYVVRGVLRVNGQEARSHQLVQFRNDGERIEIEAIADSIILFGNAVPNREPIAAYGPFVMNTQKEIFEAINDFRAGKFGQWRED